MESGIRIDDVSFHYPNKTEILKHITLTIPHGAFFGITGVNGSGKSTLTYLVNGLIPHSIPGRFTGNVFVDGTNTRTKSVSYFSQSVGMVFQNPDFSLFNLTVAEEISFGLKNVKHTVNNRIIQEALGLVDLSGFENRDPQTLSFGEKQKVCLGSVLALNVSYIILDEPSAMLDYKSSCELYELLKTLNQKGKTIVVIEHDTDFLWDFTSKTVILDHGTIIENGKTREVLSNTKLLTSLGIKKPRGAHQ
jgi:energy-coupling factor transport system ATP-binding protein